METDIPPYWMTMEATLFRSDPAMAELGEEECQAPRITMSVELDGVPEGTLVEYLAARPADYRASYHGSGLPFANPEMAYDRTPNHGLVEVREGMLTWDMYLPNSFYVDLGRTLLIPHVLLRIKGHEHYHIVSVANPTPHRSLTHLPDNYPRAQNHPQRFVRLTETIDRPHMPRGLFPDEQDDEL